MLFAPAIPIGGLAGFRFLERTFDSQLATFSRSPDIQREIDYFLANAGQANSTEALLADRRVLRVALGAFGLEDQAGKTAFLRKILDDGTLEDTALANRLSDKSWARFSEAMGFGNFGGALNTSARREEIAELFRLRQFEASIGEIDFDISLAIGFRRQIGEIAVNASVDQAGWFQIMGSQELRQVVEGAFNLPGSFGRLDIEDQRRILEERSERILGSESPSVFSDPAAVDQVLARFLLNAQLQGGVGQITPGSTALSLLQSGGLAGGARSNLFQSLL